VSRAGARQDADADNPDPRLRAQRAQLLALRGEQRAATQLARALWQSGYRDAELASLLPADGLPAASTPVAAKSP
jgi:hypothetical protein